MSQMMPAGVPASSMLAVKASTGVRLSYGI